MTKIEETAKRVADSTLLTAGARVVMVIGVPVTLLIAGAYAGEITGLHRKVQSIEIKQAEMAAAQNAVANRLTALESQNISEAGRFATLEREIASMTATINAMNRNVERLLNRAENGLRLPPVSGPR